jgi:FkbM family methyltransferase
MALYDHLLDFLINKFANARAKRKQKLPSYFTPDQLTLFGRKGTYIYKDQRNSEFILHNDSLLSKAILDGFEENELNFTYRYLKHDDVFFDIGANIGLFAITASKKIQTGKIFAFEPSPKTYERLSENIKLNKGSNLVYPQNIALSNQRNSLDFYLSLDGFDAWNSFTLAQVGSTFQRVKIDTISLDIFCSNNNISRIDLIKIDVEGWELPVLEGARHTIEKYSPDFLIEFTEENAVASGFKCSMLFDFLKEYGYHWYEFNSDLSLTKAERKDFFNYCNLLATKNIDSAQNRLSI